MNVENIQKQMDSAQIIWPEAVCVGVERLQIQRLCLSVPSPLIYNFRCHFQEERYLLAFQMISLNKLRTHLCMGDIALDFHLCRTVEGMLYCSHRLFCPVTLCLIIEMILKHSLDQSMYRD